MAKAQFCQFSDESVCSNSFEIPSLTSPSSSHTPSTFSDTQVVRTHHRRKCLQVCQLQFYILFIILINFSSLLRGESSISGRQCQGKEAVVRELHVGPDFGTVPDDTGMLRDCLCLFKALQLWAEGDTPCAQSLPLSVQGSTTLG